MQIASFEIYRVEDALQRLRKLLGPIPACQNLWSFLPEGLKDGLIIRSAVASTFAASLELAKEGRLTVRQTETFGAIQIKPGVRNNDAVNDADNAESNPPTTNENEDE